MADLDHARLRVDRDDVEDRGRGNCAEACLHERAAVDARRAFHVSLPGSMTLLGPHPEERAKPASRRMAAGTLPPRKVVAPRARPSFETHRSAMLLRMRAEEH